MVRFLTGRYLSEYASPEEVTYERNVLVDEKQVSIKITDVAGKVELLCHVHVYREGTCCRIEKETFQTQFRLIVIILRFLS